MTHERQSITIPSFGPNAMIKQQSKFGLLPLSYFVIVHFNALFSKAV